MTGSILIISLPVDLGGDGDVGSSVCSLLAFTSVVTGSILAEVGDFIRHGAPSVAGWEVRAGALPCVCLCVECIRYCHCTAKNPFYTCKWAKYPGTRPALE